MTDKVRQQLEENFDQYLGTIVTQVQDSEALDGTLAEEIAAQVIASALRNCDSLERLDEFLQDGAEEHLRKRQAQLSHTLSNPTEEPPLPQAITDNSISPIALEEPLSVPPPPPLLTDEGLPATDPDLPTDAALAQAHVTQAPQEAHGAGSEEDPLGEACSLHSAEGASPSEELDEAPAAPGTSPDELEARSCPIESDVETGRDGAPAEIASGMASSYPETPESCNARADEEADTVYRNSSIPAALSIPAEPHTEAVPADAGEAPLTAEGEPQQADDLGHSADAHSSTTPDSKPLLASVEEEMATPGDQLMLSMRSNPRAGVEENTDATAEAQNDLSGDHLLDDSSQPSSEIHGPSVAGVALHSRPPPLSVMPPPSQLPESVAPESSAPSARLKASQPPATRPTHQTEVGPQFITYSGHGGLVDELGNLALAGFPNSPLRSARFCVLAILDDLGLEPEPLLSDASSKVASQLEVLRRSWPPEGDPAALIQAWQRTTRRESLRAVLDLAAALRLLP